MTFEKAMKKADRGVKVRHPDMNARWGVVSRGDKWMFVSNVGGSYEYLASVSDRSRDDWEVMKAYVEA